MSRGSSNFFIFFIILAVLGAILAVGANQFHYGFFNGNFISKNFTGRGLESTRSNFFDSKSSSRENSPEVPLARMGRVNEDGVQQRKSKKAISKIDKATLDKHKDELERRDRAELNDLIDKVGK